MIALKITWHVNGLTDAQTTSNVTTVLVGPGQDITRDVPLILATATWADNSLAHRVTVDRMELSDVSV